MAYNYSHFAEIEKLRLPERASVLDLGSQDVCIESSAELHEINRFLRPKPLAVQTPVRLEARAVFERAGCGYWCVDVDGRPGTMYVDLNQYVFPEQLKNRMDFVANCGTTEHLANPVCALALMHYAAKKDAILFHDVPVWGYDNHALINPTPKFWHRVIVQNAYEVLLAEIRTCRHQDVDSCFVDGPYASYMKVVNTLPRTHAMIRLILRKTTEAVFIPPFDVDISVLDFTSECRLVKGALDPFVKTGAITEAEVDAAARAVSSPAKKLGSVLKRRTR